MFEVYVPTKLYFGVNALDQIATLQLPGKKALIVISKGKSVTDTGYLERLKTQLLKSDINSTVYSGITANPTTNQVMEAALMARDNGCDFIIGFGGGSCLDAAKVIAMMATNPGEVWDYCQRGTGARKQPANKALPIVCITTTAGTGSEADASGMINNLQTHEKFGIGGNFLFPEISVIDPALTVSVPPLQAAYQGLDAFFHCAEGYLSKKANLFNEMYAITGVQNIAEYLPRVMKDPRAMEAREHVSFANTLGGYVMSTGKLMSQHSLEHILSAYHPDLPHGAGLILLSRAYFSHFIHNNIRAKKFIALAQAMGEKEADKPEDFLLALEKLFDVCGVSNLRMQDWGITKEELREHAIEVKEKFGDLFLNDPKELSVEDCLKIFMDSYEA